MSNYKDTCDDCDDELICDYEFDTYKCVMCGGELDLRRTNGVVDYYMCLNCTRYFVVSSSMKGHVTRIKE